MSEKMSYTEAFEELQRLVNDIESGEISVDLLAEKVKRAATLIKICRQKLTTTEAEVNQILKGLEEEKNPEPIAGNTP